MVNVKPGRIGPRLRNGQLARTCLRHLCHHGHPGEREREGGPKFVNLLAPPNGARCFCPGHLIAKVDQFHRAKRPRFNLAEQLETRCLAWSAINRSRAAESAPLIYLCALIECWPAVILLVGH